MNPNLHGIISFLSGRRWRRNKGKQQREVLVMLASFWTVWMKTTLKFGKFSATGFGVVFLSIILVTGMIVS